MNYKDLYDRFDKNGKLLFSGATIDFDSIGWSKHPTFEGVELKHIVTSKQTNGQFSYHLVRVAPNKKIGNHIHEKQLETHEVIAGGGVCVTGGKEFVYQSGVISILPMGIPHEVIAGENGLYIFAKFIPALC